MSVYGHSSNIHIAHRENEEIFDRVPLPDPSISLPDDPKLIPDIDLLIYRIYLTMQMYQKLLQVYQSLSEQIVLACEPYARKSLAFKAADWEGRKGYRNRAIYSWYHKLSKEIQRYSESSLKDQIVCHNDLKRTILRYHHSMPDEVSDMSPLDQMTQYTPKFGAFDSEELKEPLSILLSSREEAQALLSLKDRQATNFLDLLDKMMDFVEPTSALYLQCLRRLRRLCGVFGALPSSCVLNSEKQLEKTSTEALLSGGFADIWRGKYEERDTVIDVAIKVLRIYGKENLQVVRQRFCREAVLWRRFTHPNILRFLGVSTTLFPLCLISTWMSNGNIMSFLRAHPQANRVELLVDIGKGLKYLHSIGVIHGDLKGANILVDDKYHAVLSDFGLTAVTYDPHTVNAITTSAEVMGSVRWMAPEVINPDEAESRRQSPESDIYALGMVIWEVFSGKVPYHQWPRDATVVFKILLGIRPERPSDASALGLSDAVWNVIGMCWQDWRKRPRVLSVLQCLEEAFKDFIPPPFVPPAPKSLHPLPLHFDAEIDDEGNDIGVPFLQDFTNVPDNIMTAFENLQISQASQVPQTSAAADLLSGDNTSLVLELEWLDEDY
ncbi:hypothetical protein D9758_008509 [Tetrapyrgos nigripes]|uniref:Protein kinase domain-containing protein n=1 Tax=Tetrapyrgos nigripes TaxID=182062 RepID=A0A8H5CP24_9AGAR|nr:hypothetical protein D9758_008509 [Tetrapyrgos nigripes]